MLSVLSFKAQWTDFRVAADLFLPFHESEWINTPVSAISFQSTITLSDEHSLNK